MHPKNKRRRIHPELSSQKKFIDLAKKFRKTDHPETAKRLGDKLGRMVFGE
jgi:hypothetical protein